MKKLKTIVLLAIVCALGCACLAACGEKDTPGGGDPVAPVVPNTPTAGLAYALNEDGAGYTVTGLGEATDKNLVIPTEHEGKPVTKIGKQAFLNKRIYIDSVVIPNGIEEIEEGAFQGCASMTEVHIAASVETVGARAFFDCSALTIYCEATSTPAGWENALPWPAGDIARETPVILDCNNNDKDSRGYRYEVIDGVRYQFGTENASVARQPENLYGEIVIPQTVTYQGSSYTCQSIASQAFYRCASLVGITIPRSVLYVGADVTQDCYALTVYCEQATQPGSWTQNWNSGECPIAWNGSKVVAGGARYRFIDGVRYERKENADSVAVVMQPHMGEKRTIADEVTWGNRTYPVTAIKDSAFVNCIYMREITIGKNVTEIGQDVFGGCNMLQKLTVASGNAKFRSAGNCIIETESKTVVVGCNGSVIPDDGSVEKIGRNAFAGCSRLVSMDIPDSVTEIGVQAFDYCRLLETVKIGAGVTKIGSAAFRSCSKLKNLVIPQTVTTVGSRVFFNIDRDNAVYCEAAEKPEGWDSDWDCWNNGATRIRVVWDCKNQ